MYKSEYLLSGPRSDEPCQAGFACHEAKLPVLASWRAPRVLAVLLLSQLWLAGRAGAGTVINAATTGSAGSPVTVASSAPTRLLNANVARYGWTLYCAGTAGSVAALMMPGDSSGNGANPPPSQTAGFPIPANTLITNMDFPLRGLDAIHQRVDAEAQGSLPITCYTWEEQ